MRQAAAIACRTLLHFPGNGKDAAHSLLCTAVRCEMLIMEL
jgi:hypothetical protein